MRAIFDPSEEARLTAAVIPTNMLWNLARLAREQQIDCTDWLKGMRLDLQALEDPQTRVSYRQAAEILIRALPALGRPDQGLLLGCGQNIGNFGLLGLAMKTAPTFGDAMRLGMTYQHTTHAMLDLNVETGTPGEVALVARAPVTVPDILPFLCEEMFASSLVVARELVGAAFRPLRVELAYPAPAYVERYAEMFQCELHFEQPRNALVIGSEWMQFKFPGYNAVSARQAMDLCRRQLADFGTAQGELAQTVERYLRQHLHENPPLASVAYAMHLSERTLRRRLAADGISFSMLHDRIRTARALELLRQQGLTISQVGTQVGFADAREFRRAFKRWTGRTPSESRDQMA